MSWQNWEQTWHPKLVLILHLCLLLLGTSFKDIYFLIFTKIINDDDRNFRKQTKEENKSHSEIIINFFRSVFGFMTCFWPMHKHFYQKYDHAHCFIQVFHFNNLYGNSISVSVTVLLGL